METVWYSKEEWDKVSFDKHGKLNLSSKLNLTTGLISKPWKCEAYDLEDPEELKEGETKMTMKTIIYCDRCQTPVQSSRFDVSMSRMTVIQYSRCHGEAETTITRFEDIDKGTCNILHVFQKDAREGVAMTQSIMTAEEVEELNVTLSKPKQKRFSKTSIDRLSFTTPKRETREEGLRF